MVQVFRMLAPGVLAGLLCGAIGCGAGGGSPLTAPTALAAPLLTPGCGTVNVTMSSAAGARAPAQLRVERSTDGGSAWTTVATVPATPTATSITLADQPSQALLFRYFTSDGTTETGPSPAAATVAFGIPDAPTAVVALPGSSLATVTWHLPASANGSPLTQIILADEVGAGNRYQFPAAGTATRALVGDEAHPLFDSAGATWSFRINATNQCGTSTSDPSAAIRTEPWNLTPAGEPPALGTTLFGTALAQIDGTQYLIGGSDDDLQILGVTLRTSQDPATPKDGRLLPWRESGVLNVPRSLAAAAANRALNGDAYLYAIGGRDLGFQLSSDVEAGQVQADGSVDWSIAPQVAGSPLSEPRASAAAFVHGQFLYVLGGTVRDPGSDVESLSRDVLVTRINADGTLPQDAVVDGQTVPAWRRAGTTPPGFHSPHRSGAAAVVIGNFLFVIGGNGLQDDLPFPFVLQMNTVHRIKLRDDGLLDCPDECNWVQMPDVSDASGAPFPLAQGAAFLKDGRLYYVGGFGVLQRGPVLMASLVPDDNGDPVSGPWTELPTFSAPPRFDGESDRDFAAGFSLGSYLYVAGGLSFKGADLIPTALGDSLFAHLSRDGRIGP